MIGAPTPTGIRVAVGRQTLLVDAWGVDTVRVQAAIDGAFAPVDDALVVTAGSPASVSIARDRATVASGRLTVVVGADGHLAFHRDADAEPVLEEPPQHPLMGSQNPPMRVFHRVRDAHAGEAIAWRISQTFAAADGERLYGLGQRSLGRLDLKGCVLDLVQRNAEVSVPVVASSRGYGLFWNSPSSGQVEFGVNRTRWTADRAAQIDYFIYLGDRPQDLLERYFAITGFPRRLPTWVTGFWQSRTRYTSQDEVLEVAREHRRRSLPISAILVDFFHATHMGDFDWDEAQWPDPAGMIAELRDLGVEPVISVWPHVSPRSPNYLPMRNAGFLARRADGTPATFPFADLDAPNGIDLALYDATNPDARAFVWSEIRRHNHAKGARAYWVDACEPELGGTEEAPLAAQVRFQRGHGEAISSLYPFLVTTGLRDGLDAEGLDGTDVVLITRSAWAGSQRLGAIVWSGDTLSSWATLAGQVRAGLGMMMSGIPWWSSDTGGFVGGDNDDEGFRELLIRWFAFSVFTPVLRLHGLRGLDFSLDNWTRSGAPNELWSFGNRVYEILRSFVLFRERLRPYVETQLARAASTGMPPMRPLFFDHPDDPLAASIDDAYLFGPDILVAPVVEPGATTRQVYVPRGSTWRDPWTGRLAPHGTRIALATPLDRLPILVRVGGSVAIDESWLDAPSGSHGASS